MNKSTGKNLSKILGWKGTPGITILNIKSQENYLESKSSNCYKSGPPQSAALGNGQFK